MAKKTLCTFRSDPLTSTHMDDHVAALLDLAQRAEPVYRGDLEPRGVEWSIACFVETPGRFKVWNLSLDNQRRAREIGIPLYIVND